MIAKLTLSLCAMMLVGCPGPRDERHACAELVRPALTNAVAEPPRTLSHAEVAAIGAIELAGGGLRCTGTLIAKHWVLTAKHCLSRADEALVFRTAVGREQVRVPMVQAFSHPELDVMLFEIPPTVAAQWGDVQPIEPWALATIEVGGALILSGYGDAEDGTSGSLRFLEEAVVEVGETTITVDGGAEHGACFRDSGGPLFAVDSDGRARVVGVLSTGDSSCTGRDTYVRLSAVMAWIEATQSARVESPCDDASWEGTCLSSRAQWCELDHVAVADCEGKQVCGWDVEQGGFRCIEDGVIDPCRGAGTSGTCEDGTLLTCERGVLTSTDCAACGLTCVWDAGRATCG